MIEETTNTGLTFTDSDVADEGTYECILKLDVREGSNGQPRLSCAFTIRGDVNQPFKGTTAFMNLFLDNDFNTKELTEYGRNGWFSYTKTKALTRATPTEQEGGKRSFANVDEWIQYMNGQCMKVTFSKVFDDFRNDYANKIVDYTWAKTEHPKKDIREVVSATPTTPTVDPLSSDDEKLPF